MPRLGIHLDNFVERNAPTPDKFGRRVRHVNTVEYGAERSRLFDPILVKFAAGLAIIAAVAMTIALWRLFTFPH